VLFVFNLNFSQSILGHFTSTFETKDYFMDTKYHNSWQHWVQCSSL